jgi:hypothetical protein
MSSLDVTADPPRAARPAAFRRPGLVLAYAGYLLVAGFGVAAPWSALLTRTVVGYPRGDAELFDRGGVMLVEAIRLGGRGAPAAMASSGFVVLLAGAFGLVPLAMLLAGLGREGRVRAPFLAARAVGSLGTLTLIWGLSFAAQAILGALLGLLGVTLVGAFHLAPRGEALAHVGVGVVALLALLPLGVARDLAMASAVNDATRLYTSSSRALRVLRGGLVRPLGAYLARALLALAALLVAFWIPTVLRAPDAPLPVALPLLLHQLAIVGAVFLRASWLAAAIRLLDARTPLPAPVSAFAEPEGTLAAPERGVAEPDAPLAEPDATLAEPDATLAEPDGSPAPPDEPTPL